MNLELRFLLATPSSTTVVAIAEPCHLNHVSRNGVPANQDLPCRGTHATALPPPVAHCAAISAVITHVRAIGHRQHPCPSLSSTLHSAHQEPVAIAARPSCAPLASCCSYAGRSIAVVTLASLWRSLRQTLLV